MMSVSVTTVATILLKVIPSIYAFFRGRRRKLHEYIEEVAKIVEDVEGLQATNGQKRERALHLIQKKYPKMLERHARTTVEMINAQLKEGVEEEPESHGTPTVIVNNYCGHCQ